MKDYYSILGVGENASPDDIKQAYRQLAQKYHPDRNPGNAEAEGRFKSISEANQVLSDPSKRQQYNQARHGGLGMPGGDFLSDIFESFGFRPFRNHQRSQPQKTPDNTIVRIDVSLSEIEKGSAHRTLTIKKNVTCEGCGGVGGDSTKVCESCHGRGDLIQEFQQGSMRFQSKTTCPQCRGKGRCVVNACTICQGGGHVLQQDTYKITLSSEKL